MFYRFFNKKNHNYKSRSLLCASAHTDEIIKNKMKIFR
jgi:hypothetical protein